MWLYVVAVYQCKQVSMTWEQQHAKLWIIVLQYTCTELNIDTCNNKDIKSRGQSFVNIQYIFLKRIFHEGCLG